MAVQDWAVPTPIYQFLATSTGGTSVIGDYSTGKAFYIQPSSTQAFRIERMLIHIQDTGIFAAEEYGKLSALTNGIQVRVQSTLAGSTGTIHDITDGMPVKTNAQWGRHCYDVRVDTWGVGDEFLSARWTFSKGGYPIRLDGSKGERLEVYLTDSTTGLNGHDFYVNGFVEDEAWDHWQ